MAHVFTQKLTEQYSSIVITKPSNANTMRLAEIANPQSAFVLVIADTHKCPRPTVAPISFIAPTGTFDFFSLYAATIIWAEALIGMLAAEADNAVLEQIEKAETAN